MEMEQMSTSENRGGDSVSESGELAAQTRVERAKSDFVAQEDGSAKRLRVWSTVPNQGVDLAIGKSGLASIAPETVGEMFQDTYRRYPHRDALVTKIDRQWVPVTYSQYYDSCFDAAKSFKKLGLQRFEVVAIIGFNFPERLYASIGAIFAGGLSTGIYADNSPEACLYVAQHSKANIIVVENQMQLDKILHVRDRLPSLKAIVQYRGKLSREYKDVYDWEQFMDLGKDIENSEIDDIMKQQEPSDCAVLIYTSGTTGNPKCVMCSHDNFTYAAKAFLAILTRTVNWTRGMPARIISYLQLNHIAGQNLDIYLSIYAAATVFFAQPDALKGSLYQTLVEVKPTLFYGAPRVYERMMETMQQAEAQASVIKKKIDTWATSKGYQGNINIQKKCPVPWGWTVANMFLESMKRKVGLQECKIVCVGGAPAQHSVLEYFMRYNLPLMDFYGMCENAGTISYNTIADWKFGSVGKCIEGTHIKIHNLDEKGEGEICVRGRQVCMGYLHDEERTREDIDDEGWFHTGDLGRMDEDGFLFMTGRIKEIIVTSDGEKIYPVFIEDRIKDAVPFLSNVVVIGDKRKYLSCLVTLKCVMDPATGEPKDELTPHAIAAMKALGCDLTCPSEIAKEKVEVVLRQVQQGLDKANSSAISTAQRVHRFTVLAADFSLPGGELGPTLKLRRKVVVEKYEAEIDAMYKELPPVVSNQAGQDMS